MTNTLSDQDKKALLVLARQTVSAILSGTLPPETDQLPAHLQEVLSCFVTLHTSSGQLRGCIGNIIAFEPLVENVINNAKNSAFNDPRFPSVSSLDELNDLEIEISVLTPPEQIKSLDDFTIGEHGIILKKHGRSAVFLPQVAPEQGWDKATTLTHLSMKAGLSPDAWQEPDATFEVFSAIVFSEKDFA